jgi:hypothetical protein
VILTELLALSKLSSGQCRILFSNREGTNINKTLSNRPTISLKDQHADVNKDIEAYVHSTLRDFRGRFGDRLIDHIESIITTKADGIYLSAHEDFHRSTLTVPGMFLWVRLVMRGLENCYSPRDLVNTVDKLPKGLDEA